MQLALLFEIKPKPETFDGYLAIAARLRPELDASGGCLFIDRFRCVREPARILSLQIWRDEAAREAAQYYPRRERAVES